MLLGSIPRILRGLCGPAVGHARRAATTTWRSHRINRAFFGGGRGGSKKDYYTLAVFDGSEILGVQKGASKPEIKKAFAKLAQELHPDKNPAPDAKQKFQDITEAYQTLNDDKKREMYDSYGMTADEQTNFNQAGGGGPRGPDFNQQDFQDFFKSGEFNDMFKDFESFFGMGGGGAQGQRQSRGTDILLNLEITFMESVMGVTKEINFNKKGVCGTCQGSRCKPGTSASKCTTCGGSGHVNMRQGPMSIHMVCSKCKGSGETIKSPCSTCNGSGTANSTVRESITIPKGINNGQNLRVNGKGGITGPDAPPGDLIIKITVKPDPYFKRDGFDIHTTALLTIPQAVLGTSLEVKTLYGSQKVDIPAGTADGQVMRLKNQGVTKLAPNQHQKGDHLITFKISIPSKLSAQQKEIFEQLRDLETKKTN